MTHFAQWQITDIRIFRPSRLLLPPPATALGEYLTHPNQTIEEALIWTLKVSFPKQWDDYATETWREHFHSVTATVMRGLSRANTGT